MINVFKGIFICIPTHKSILDWHEQIFCLCKYTVVKMFLWLPIYEKRAGMYHLYFQARRVLILEAAFFHGIFTQPRIIIRSCPRIARVVLLAGRGAVAAARLWRCDFSRASSGRVRTRP